MLIAMEKIINSENWILRKLLNYPVLEDNQLKLAQTVITTLTILQTWATKRNALISFLYYFPVFLFCNVVVYGFWAHIIKLYLLHELSYSKIAVDLAILTICISGYQYCGALYRQRHNAQRLITELGDFRGCRKPPGVEVTDALLNAVFGSVLVVQVSLVPILLGYYLPQECAEDDYSCGLFVPGYFPGAMAGIRRKIMAVVQLFSLWFYVTLGTGCLWVGTHMTEYVILYLKHCQTLVQQTTQFVDFRQRREHVVDVLRYHHRIIYLYDQYKVVVPGLFVMHAILTPVVIAVMVQSFIVDFRVQSFLIFVICVLTFFLICFMGQRMIDESQILAECIYEAVPMDGDLETSNMLRLMLLRTQKALIVPAGPLTSCDYELFVIAMKASYSYLTLIQNTK